MTRHTGWVVLCGLCAALLLSACSPGYGDLREWMQSERGKMTPVVPRIKEPAQFVPLAYTEEDLADPFGRERLTSVLRRESQTADVSTSLIAPELNRRKEPLEAYPLDAITMVGSMSRAGVPVALVLVDKLLYQVRVGDYLGKNYGKVMKIAEGQVVLREIVQDGVGEWVERPAELQLQEGKQ